MSIPELQKFREKYPQYNDLDDKTIAQKLAQKYPEAYSDLPAKMQASMKPKLEGVTPEQYGMIGRAITRPLPFQSPLLPGQERFEQGLGRGIGAGVNAASFNLLNSVLRKYGINMLPPATTPEQKAGEFAGTIGGTIISPITKAGMAISKAPREAKFLTKVGRSALGGATMGGAYTPEEDILAPKQRLGLAIGGGILGGLATSAGQLKKYLNPKNQIKIAEEARNNLWSQKQVMIDKYGKNYQEIVNKAQGKISLREPLQGLLENTDDAINTIKGIDDFNLALAQKDPSAKKLLNLITNFRDNPNIPMNIDIQEADALQKFIRQMPGIKSKLAQAYKRGFEQVDFTNAERILLDFANELKANVMNLAPEMSILNKEYGSFMNNYKQIRPYLRWDKAVTNFRNLEKLDPAVQQKFVETLPANITRNIQYINRATRMGNLLKWTLGAGFVGGVAGETGRKIMFRR